MNSAVFWRMNTLFDGIPPAYIQKAKKATWYCYLYAEYFIKEPLRNTTEQSCHDTQKPLIWNTFPTEFHTQCVEQKKDLCGPLELQ